MFLLVNVLVLSFMDWCPGLLLPADACFRFAGRN